MPLLSYVLLGSAALGAPDRVVVAAFACNSEQLPATEAFSLIISRFEIPASLSEQDALRLSGAPDFCIDLAAHRPVPAWMSDFVPAGWYDAAVSSAAATASKRDALAGYALGAPLTGAGWATTSDGAQYRMVDIGGVHGALLVGTCASSVNILTFQVSYTNDGLTHGADTLASTDPRGDASATALRLDAALKAAGWTVVRTGSLADGSSLVYMKGTLVRTLQTSCDMNGRFASLGMYACMTALFVSDPTPCTSGL